MTQLKIFGNIISLISLVNRSVQWCVKFIRITPSSDFVENRVWKLKLRDAEKSDYIFLYTFSPFIWRGCVCDVCVCVAPGCLTYYWFSSLTKWRMETQGSAGLNECFVILTRGKCGMSALRLRPSAVATNWSKGRR